MNFKTKNLLYLITDRNIMSSNSIEECVTQAILGGCDIVQLREKSISSCEFYNIALNLRKITKKFNIKFIINDRVDIALAVDADGVHVGQKDLPCKIVRNILKKEKIVGVSANNLSEALKATKDGADYLGVGSIFTTSTKKDANPVTINELTRICHEVNIPVFAIGGINKNNVLQLKNSGISGVAVASAIISQDNIINSTKELKKILLEI